MKNNNLIFLDIIGQTIYLKLLDTSGNVLNGLLNTLLIPTVIYYFENLFKDFIHRRSKSLGVRIHIKI